jgi:hypothetical protein
MRKISFAVLLVPALAWGQPRTADDWYKEGENQYNLGNFDRAVDAFKQGFQLETNESKKANYLYNVAQAYRKANDCKNAQFFYRRYLALKENDTVKPLAPSVRRQVEERISDLDACVQQQQSISRKPPNNSMPPDSDGSEKSPPPGETPPRKELHKDVAQATPPGEADQPEEPVVTRSTVPRLISARLTGGATKIETGTSMVTVPVQARFSLTAGYPIPVARNTTLEVGGAATFSPVPLNGQNMAAGKTAQVWTVGGNVGATYEVLPNLGVHADVTAGALFLANVSESAFTDGAPATGALTMFHVRGSVAAEYAVTPNLVLTLAPIAVGYSPAKSGLDKDIKGLTSIDFAMVGIGYRK